MDNTPNLLIWEHGNVSLSGQIITSCMLRWHPLVPTPTSHEWSPHRSALGAAAAELLQNQGHVPNASVARPRHLFLRKWPKGSFTKNTKVLTGTCECRKRLITSCNASLDQMHLLALEQMSRGHDSKEIDVHRNCGERNYCQNQLSEALPSKNVSNPFEFSGCFLEERVSICQHLLAPGNGSAFNSTTSCSRPHRLWVFKDLSDSADGWKNSSLSKDCLQFLVFWVLSILQQA